MTRLLNLNGKLIDADKQLLDLDRLDCEQDLYTFLTKAWEHFDPAEFKGSWAIQAIAEHLMGVVDGDIKRLMIHVPPRTSKSTLCSVAFPAWTWAQSYLGPTSGPGVRFMYASHSESLAMDHSVLCRRLIRSEWYRSMWGDRFRIMADEDTKHKFSNSKGGAREITSIDARITGKGAQVILVDDANPTNEVTESALNKVNTWWTQTMASRLNDKNTGAFIVVQQRVAENDLSGHILDTSDADWDHLMIPMCYEPERSFYTSIGWKDPRSEPGELLWPERFNAGVVRSLEREAGTWVWSGQYQQRPEPAGGGIIKRDWWKTWEENRACGQCDRTSGQMACDVCPSPKTEFPPFDFIMASLDTAYTEKEENDPSAMTVWGVFSGDTVAQQTRFKDRWGGDYYERQYVQSAPKLMLIHAWREHLEFPDLVRKVADSAKKWKIDLLVIENKAAGISTAQELRRLVGNAEYGIHLYDPKNSDKVSRLHSVAHLFEEGLIYAPDRKWADMVITEVAQFPKGRYRDLTDTVSQAIRHLRERGLLTRGPERQAEMDDAKQYAGAAPEPLYPA